MLLDPFEEQLHAPSVAVQLADKFWRGIEIVGQKDVSFAVFRINVNDFTKLLRVIL